MVLPLLLFVRPEGRIAMLSHMLVDQIRQHAGLKSVQLPALVTVLGGVAGEATVCHLGRIRWWTELLDLIPVQCQALDLHSLPSHEQIEPVLVVPGHVDAGWIVISEVQDDCSLFPVQLVMPGANVCSPLF